MKPINISERAQLVLGVDKCATEKQIKKQYYRKAKENHPDICNDKIANDKMALITESYKYLKGDRIKINLLKNNDLMKQVTDMDFINELTYEEWHKNQFYGFGVI